MFKKEKVDIVKNYRNYVLLRLFCLLIPFVSFRYHLSMVLHHFFFLFTGALQDNLRVELWLCWSSLRLSSLTHIFSIFSFSVFRQSRRVYRYLFFYLVCSTFIMRDWGVNYGFFSQHLHPFICNFFCTHILKIDIRVKCLYVYLNVLNNFYSLFFFLLKIHKETVQ